MTPKIQPRAIQITRIQTQIRTSAVQTELTTHLSTSPLKQQHVYTGEMQQRLHTYTDAHNEMQPTFSIPESFQTRSGTRNSYIKLRLTTHTRTQMDAARTSHMLTHTTRTREHIRAAINNHAPPNRTHTHTHKRSRAQAKQNHV